MRLRFLALFVAVFAACSTHSGSDSPLGAPLSGFPTTATPALSNGESYGPKIATAVNTLAASVIADLTTLNTNSSGSDKVRAVITALPGAYVGTTTGTLTASAAGAIAAQQGVTLVAGDQVWLAAGATNITAAADAGPYTVTDVGVSSGDAASARYVLTRPTWWSHGSTIPVGASVAVGGEDTLFGGSRWYTYAAKGSVVDTADPAGYPDAVTQQVTLLTGSASVAITNVPMRSATSSSVLCSYVSGTAKATTVAYGQGVITPGAINSATVTVKAYIVGMVAAASGDVSVLNCTTFN